MAQYYISLISVLKECVLIGFILKVAPTCDGAEQCAELVTVGRVGVSSLSRHSDKNRCTSAWYKWSSLSGLWHCFTYVRASFHGNKIRGMRISTRDLADFHSLL